MEVRSDEAQLNEVLFMGMYLPVCASCNVQNEASRPSWTDSGGQDGVFGVQNTGQKWPEGGSNLPIPGAKTEGVQNQRTKTPKERFQISRKSSSSR